MSDSIHKTAIVSKKAKIDNNVIIGPYCVIGDDVKIYSKTILISHVSIVGKTTIGKNNTFFPFSTIGQIPQDKKYLGEKSSLLIGDNNVFRENVTVNTGTVGGGMKTKIQNNCLFMVGSHVAHDCKISNNVILANNATLAGHVSIDDNAIIGGLSAIHQYVRIGKYSMIGGMSGVEQDIIPYGLYMGIRSNLRGLNIIGLKRKGLNSNKILKIKKFYNSLFDKKFTIIKNIQMINKKQINMVEINEVLEFLKDKSSRGVCTP